MSEEEREVEVEIIKVLRHLEDIEAKMAKLYGLFSEKFAEDAEVAFLFYRMSMEEKSHAALVRYEMRLVKQNPKLFPRVPLDLREILHQKAELNDTLDQFGVYGIREAVRLTLLLESSVLERHCRSAATASVPELARLLGSLCASDRTHVKQVEDFARVRGYLASPKEAAP